MQFLSQGRVPYKNKKVYPKTISTYNAVNTISNAAKNNDQELYSMIKDEDLIAKEFKYHEHCYIDFTRNNSLPHTQLNEKEDVYDKGDFEKVKNLISEEVLYNGRAISIRVFHSAYGLKENDNRFRNKLKGRI